MATLIQFKRGTASALAATNPYLGAGEPCFELDTGKVKVGTGNQTSYWNNLPYIEGGSGPGAEMVGSTGATGATGATGSAGLTGATGVVGATGATGPQGISGLVGATGASGVAGASGAIGPQGITGATGPQGISGVQGATGVTGPQGPTGVGFADGDAINGGTFNTTGVTAATTTIIQFKRGTAASLANTNPTPAAGEPLFESDTNKMKLGDGTTTYTLLPYFNGNGKVAATPASSSAAGKSGEMLWDASYLYIHIGTGWRRIAHSSW